MPAAARRGALLDAASGEAGIVIGTHALLEDKVQFADLGLVVVDEQHRFGVEQRAALSTRTDGPRPHVLVMTATPIPRTVAMTVFGDLETSALAELPAGRGEIQTTVVPLAEQPAWLERVWTRVREEVDQGRQVYVVCPRISGNEDAEVVTDPDEEQPPADADDSGDAGNKVGAGGGSRSADKPPPAAVEELLPRLVDGPLEGLRVSALHGRLPPETKDEVMRAFADGQVDVLVSTTVIEVGVDVANATTMVVLDAERFGVSQLHQLRGRVGRGGHHGLCLLVTGSEVGSRARERLEAVAGTVDGFRLAELDLTLRREGDVLGSNQSGSRRYLKLLSVVRDADLIEGARDAAVDLVERDPTLVGEPDLLAEVEQLHESERSAYLDKT
jgi:ATP-dependent DNA helicase RecG